MYPFDDGEDELEPVPFIPNHSPECFDDLAGSGFSGLESYGKFYDGDFDDLVNDNFRSLVSPLDELEDLAPDGTSLEYKARRDTYATNKGK